jgi:CSLREA domain-containing protein
VVHLGKPGVTAAAAAQNKSRIYLQDPQELLSKYLSSSEPTQSGTLENAEPLALAAVDFDGDGVTDLIAGYAAPGGGILAVHRGNLDAFAPQSPESFQAIAENHFPSPFLSDVQLIEFPIRPDFLAVGNFNGGHQDIIVASRGGNTAYILTGDGKGNFASPYTLNLPGGITALAAGKIGPFTQFNQVLIGAVANGTPELLVYSGSDQGLVRSASFGLEAPATAFDFGNLDENSLIDAVVLAGEQLLVLHSAPGNAKPSLEAVSVPVRASAVTLGRFVHDRDPRLQMAVLGSDGSIHVVAHAGIDSRGWTAEELKARAMPGRRGRPAPFSPVRISWKSENWRIVETFPGASPFSGASRVPLLLRARITDHGEDDVMVFNGAAGQMAVISHPNVPLGASSFLPGQQFTRTYSTGTPVAAISMRVNVDARPGLVVLHQGHIAPVVMMPLPDPTFNVNTTNDTVDANPGDGICADSTGKCSLRAAIMEANATSGNDTIMVPAGTYTLTITGIDEDNARTGDLDITDGVSIVGASASTTTVQAGTTSSNGIDKVFSVNPNGNSPSFATSFAGLTIRYGLNPSQISPFGGAMDFDTGLSGTGTLSITSCVITQNSINSTNALSADGGGIYLSNLSQGTGSVTISGSTISNNTAEDLGGGIYAGSELPLVISGSTISGNKSTGGGLQQGGGIVLVNPSSPFQQSAIHNSTFSSNQATKDGGGILTLQGILVDQGSVITGNTAGGNGGGLWSNTINETTTVSQSTITSNTATGNGGGVEVDTSTNGNNLSMSYSRIVGNHAASGNGLNNVSGSVTATENWWGCNAGPGAVPGTTSIFVFNTGLTASGTLAADGSTDLHYKLVGSPDPSAQGSAAILANSNAPPIPPWMSNGPNSKWLAPLSNANANLNPGAYIYETTFDLTGLDPTKAQLTGKYAADDSGVIEINGNPPFGGSASGPASFNSFSFSNPLNPFTNGLNTIDFIVSNPEGSPSPTGIRVEVSGTSSGTTLCDLVHGTNTSAFSPWIILKNSASPNPVLSGGSTTITSSVLQDSNNNSIQAGNLGAFVGRSVLITLVNNTSGFQSNVSTSIQSNGTATGSFTNVGAGILAYANATLDSGITNVVIPLQNFAVNVAPSSQSVNPGGTATHTVTATSVHGFAGNINFSVTGLPAGTTATFNPTSITNSGASTLTVVTSSSTPPGPATLTVQGASGSITQTTTTSLVVHGTIILRPTTFTSLGTAYANPANAEDGNLSTFANGIVNGGTSSEYWKSFGSAPGSASQINLKVSSAADCLDQDMDGAEIAYSLDGGSTFHHIYAQGTLGTDACSNRTQQTDTVALPATQDITKVQVFAELSSYLGSTHQVYDVWIEITY